MDDKDTNLQDSAWNDDEWDTAFDEVFGAESDNSKEEPEDEPKDNEEKSGEEASGETEDDASKDDGGASSDSDGDAEDKEEEKVDESKDEPKDEPVEKPASSDDIKEALRELDVERAEMSRVKETLRKEAVMKMAKAENLDLQMRDGDGDPINGVEGLTKLVNPNTGELFTREEAERYVDRHDQQVNRQLQELEKNAEAVVDLNIDLQTQEQKVIDIYGDILKAKPEVAQQVYEAYMKTVVRDPKTNIIVKAPISPLEFYNIAMAPYRSLADTNNQKEQPAEAPAVDPKKVEQSQRDRSDVNQKTAPPDTRSDDDKEWDTAFNSYYGTTKRRK